MGLHRGEAARTPAPIHHVPEFRQPTACGIAWPDLPFLDLATTDRLEVTCDACKTRLAGGFRVLRTLPSPAGPITIASESIDRETAMARFDEMVGWGMDRVRVVREQDYQPSEASR
ncbi:hypothetical protein Aph02nite_17060 [Actinoplanes philippinensis]|uniref:Uncharacterized protein n=1 Tax=Actinoplanes philippinensis TaxID=35752 RepID=A0A1I2BBA5_9ACTN|nr:hypothetical protein [Actinoplanes philippinensis]GIE75756.1 hypothetical protein Aph02nite_17060 [Actinoplanes philippinensis]SFE52430.1 hypothetical protein SAMN05421541_102170 [Actinoplanes philippinensis]